MARQTGIIKLKGTIGGVSFYKTRDGHLAREKGGVDKNRIMNDPAFQRTRENGSEFGRAGAAGKLLRTAIRALLINASDFRMVSRLTRDMVKVLQEDQVSERGLRNVLDGELELLQGFEFNISGKLGTTLYAPFTGTIDRALGELSIDLISFVPINMISAPGGTTHFRIVSAGAEIDFEAGTYVAQDTGTAILPYDATATAPINLVNAVTAARTKPLFLALGIEFYQEINGTQYPLKNGSYNALSLIKIDGGV
jgi:hypothetical protein